MYQTCIRPIDDSYISISTWVVDRRAQHGLVDFLDDLVGAGVQPQEGNALACAALYLDRRPLVNIEDFAFVSGRQALDQPCLGGSLSLGCVGF